MAAPRRDSCKQRQVNLKMQIPPRGFPGSADEGRLEREKGGERGRGREWRAKGRYILLLLRAVGREGRTRVIYVVSINHPVVNFCMIRDTVFPTCNRHGGGDVR